METLELRFLGDLEVVRDGEAAALPPSRKTRALLAYLALQPRKFRRERLCELLWEVPDDPRGSLRWSLSKIRRLVDDPDCQRIVADRSYVSFDPERVDIDVLRLREIVANGLANTPIEALEQAASQFPGYFLEGLELSNFHEFHAWCIAERERNTQARANILAEIIRRKFDEPDAALPFARSLVKISPYSESARESLIRLLVSSDRAGEAKQQYELGVRMLKEAGAEPTGALTRALKGKPGANAAASVSAKPEKRETPTAQALQQPQANGIVGRKAELLQIAGSIEAAIAGKEAKLLLIRGEPGIGKSRLLRAAAEIAERAEAWILESAAYESESMRPFAIWIDGLRRVLPETADQIFSARERENREKLLGGLSDLVTERSRQQPVVLLFDDLQWCDDSSATALHYIARTNRQQRVVGILTARDSEIQDNAALQQALNGLRHAGLLTEIPLAPLSETELQELIEQSAPAADSKQLSRQCGGNPLIALELARAGVSGDGGESLNELVRARLGRFDVASGEVLRWAAVMAPRIGFELLEQVTDLSSAEIADALQLADRHGMLQPADRGFRFSHDLVARSVYTDISPARRRMMHRRIAELLEQRTAVDLEHAADLAHHASQSGDAGLAARAMVSAARLCLRFYANDEALALAKRGLALVETLPPGERVCLTIDFKDILTIAAPIDDWESAVHEFVELAEQALDHGAMSHARRGYYMASYIRWMRGHWAGARDEVLQSERVSRSGSDEDHVVGMAEAARCLALLERDLTHADAMLMEAQALAARHRIAHHSIPAALGMLRYHQNRFDSAQEFFQQARTLAKSAGDRLSEYQSNEYMVMIDIERGDYRSARDRCKDLIDIGTKLRFGSEGPFARALSAVCTYAIDGESDRLEAVFHDLREADAKHRLAYALTRAAMIDLDRAEYRTAIEHAAEALENADALDRATDMLLAHVVLAKAHRAIDDETAFKNHAASIEAFDPGRVAEWARNKAREALA
jgi:DNA-binding SARP family transcriptional activator